MNDVPRCYLCGVSIHDGGLFKRANPIGLTPARWQCDPKCSEKRLAKMRKDLARRAKP